MLPATVIDCMNHEMELDSSFCLDLLLSVAALLAQGWTLAYVSGPGAGQQQTAFETTL